MTVVTAATTRAPPFGIQRCGRLALRGRVKHMIGDENRWPGGNGGGHRRHCWGGHFLRLGEHVHLAPRSASERRCHRVLGRMLRCPISRGRTPCLHLEQGDRRAETAPRRPLSDGRRELRGEPAGTFVHGSHTGSSGSGRLPLTLEDCAGSPTCRLSSASPSPFWSDQARPRQARFPPIGLRTSRIPIGCFMPEPSIAGTTSGGTQPGKLHQRKPRPRTGPPG